MTILQKHLIFIPLCFILLAGLCGLLVMLLWNWLMPTLLQLPAISYWQSVGLLLLCKILFGGFGGGHHGHPHGHGHCCDNKLRQRWESMTPEERERFIASHQCAQDPSSSDGKNMTDTSCSEPNGK